MANRQQHKLFLVTCDLGEPRSVTAVECEKCKKGNVIDGRSKVVCRGATRFFMTPCGYDMRAASTIEECDKCGFGEVSEDRLRVFCSRL